MKANRFIIAITVAGLFTAGSTAALACGGPGGGRHSGAEGFMPMRAVLHLDNLSEDQRKQLDALHEKQRKEMEQSRDDRRELREAMAKATDAKALRPLAEKEGRFVTEMIMKRLELRNEINKILTPAQRTQLQEMEKTRHEDRDDYRDRGPRV